MKHLFLHPILTGTILLTAAGFLSRILGFFYRIFLSRAIGAEGLGLYQMIFPVHGIAFALCAGPIQTAISRLTAADAAKGRALFKTGLSISLGAALVLTLLIRACSGFLAETVLLEPRCAPLLPVMALSIPFSAVHACICGYYYGLKKTAVPALSQLAEQCIRITAVFLIAGVCTENGLPLTVSLAVWGLLIGEAGAAIVSFLFYSFQPAPGKNAPQKRAQKRRFAALAAPLMAMALPLMGNRLILNFLQSLEAIFVPSRLVLSGLSPEEALSLYGSLTGMALPFIYFPSAITNSLAVVLLPAVSEAQAAGNRARIRRSVSLALRYSLSMGILCIGIFTLFGDSLGQSVYQSKSAGLLIRALCWLCPFMYLSTTTGSILNGLGKTSAVFLHHAISMLLTLSFVVFAIPRFGIAAYLAGLLLSELLLAALHLRALSREIPIFLPAGQAVLCPAISLVLAAGILFFAEPALAPFFALLPAGFLPVLFRAGLLSVLYAGGLFLLGRPGRRNRPA